MKKEMILKGDLCYSTTKDHMEFRKDAYLICRDGIITGVYDELPKQYKTFEILDFSGHLIVPGMTDLHVHAPQYAFRGMGMDMELLDWLNTHTFPEEAKYKDPAYASNAYELFTEDLKTSATTRACIFGTIHVPATLKLMELLNDAGICSYVGKVNMDRNSPDYLIEEGAFSSAEATSEWILAASGKFPHVKPILTPRFIPTCSDELMEKLRELQKLYDLPVQSHLSENQGEIDWVKELCPDARFYGDAYDRHGLFGKDVPTIMAHCVYSSAEEILRMKENGVYIAHCPQSNTNLSSGIAPVRTYLEHEMNIGLGTDVAGGPGLSMFKAIADAIQVSKLYWRLVDDSKKPLCMEEGFYLATKGGGSFFGNVGSFEDGYEADILVLDESRMRHPQNLTVKERLERFLYLADDRCVLHKFIEGRQIF